MRLLRHEKNSGPAVARNTALNVARGKYIACLDADDIFIPTALEILLNAAEKNSADVVTANGTLVSDSEQMPTDLKSLSQVIIDGVGVNEPVILTRPDDSLQSKMDRYIAGAYGFGHCWSKLYRRDFLERNHIRYRINAEDRCFTFECALHARIYIRLPQFVNVYRRIPLSLSRQPPNLQQLSDALDGLGKFARDFDESMRGIEFFEQHPEYKFAIIDLQMRQVDNGNMRYYPSGNYLNGEVIAAVARGAQETFGERGAFIAWLFNRYHLLYRQMLESAGIR